MSALIDTWHIHHRINEYLLSGIKDEHLADISLGKGRSVGHAFAHLHNVRLMWVQQAAPDLLAGINKIEKEEKITRKLLLDAFKKKRGSHRRNIKTWY